LADLLCMFEQAMAIRADRPNLLGLDRNPEPALQHS